MSGGEVKKVSHEEIQNVQNLIELCLQRYMSQKDVVNTLLEHAKVEPSFTELVWKKLEEENPEFFEAYYLCLMVKNQIVQFNGLLERHVHLARQIYPPEMSSLPMTNGSHLAPYIDHLQVNGSIFQRLNSHVHQKLANYASEHTGSVPKAENIHQSLGSCLPNTYTNSGPSLHPGLQNDIDMSAHAQKLDVPVILLARNSNLGRLQGMNGGMIKSESTYRGNTYVFGNEGNVLDPRPAMGDATVYPFNSVESNLNPLNDALLDAAGGSVGILGQIPQNFTLSDLAADFPNSSGMLESYSGSAYVADTDLDHQGR